MAKTKSQKAAMLQQLEKHLDRQKSVYFIDFQKLKAKDLFDLREKLKQAKALLFVAKKTLATIAFKKKGIDLKPEGLTGQAAMVFGFEDEVMPAKMIYEFGKEHDGPKFLGGYFENELLDETRVVNLATMPSKQELLARLLGGLSAPSSRLHSVLSKNLKGLVYLLQTLSQKQ